MNRLYEYFGLGAAALDLLADLVLVFPTEAVFLASVVERFVGALPAAFFDLAVFRAFVGVSAFGLSGAGVSAVSGCSGNCRAN